MTVLTLADLKVPGSLARIAAVTGDDAVAMRLMEMGLIEGETVSLLGFAPFGDPAEFLVRGYRLSLRGTEARRIQITPQPQTD